MRRRTVPPLPIVIAACLAVAAPCAAQVEARLDATVAVVKYDGFLSSGAAALSSSVAWRGTSATVAARGTFLLFESGNTSLQGLLSAGTFSPPVGPLRFEAAAEAGGSAYAGYDAIARFAHLLGHARVHLMGSRWGLFAGGLGGVVASPGASGSGAAGVSAGLWTVVPAGALEFTWTHATVRGATYDDLEGRMRWGAGPLTLEAIAGTRGPSGGAGSGAYGDVSTTLRLTDRLEAVVAAGGYPSDPVRGTIPGRYMTAGVRLATRALARRGAVSVMVLPPAPKPATASPGLDAVQVVLELESGQPVLVVYASGEHRVEVTGDFTDWQPVALTADGGGRYRYALPLPAGVQRFNLRLDGGPWGVPQGAAVQADEFGGSVGVLVVP